MNNRKKGMAHDVCLIELKRRYRRYEQEKRNCMVRMYPPVFYLIHSEEYCNRKEQEQRQLVQYMLEHWDDD